MKKKKCKFCGKYFIPQKYANNVKFCGIKCRNSYYYENYSKQWRRDRTQKNNLEKYDKRDLIQCKICGKWFRQVGSHIVQVHGMTAREYRKEFGYDVKKGLLPEDYRKLKSEQVSKSAIENLERGKKFWFKKGQNGLGEYERSEQSKIRLKIHGKEIARKYGFKKTGVYKKCVVCGKEFYVIRSRINKAKYCSKSCSNKNRKLKIK